MKQHALPIAVVLLVTAVLSAAQYPVPPARDQGVFLYLGWGLTEGMVPYRDMWDHKTPGVVALYAAGLALFGDRYESVNLLEILWRLATAIAIYMLAQRLDGRRAAAAAAVIYGAWSATMGGRFWFTAQAEDFMVLPIVLAVWFHLDERPRSQALAGIALGVTMVLKPTAILLYPLLIASTLFRFERRPREVLHRLLALTAGSGIIALVVLSYFAANGALQDLFDATVAFNLLYAGVAKPAMRLFSQLGRLFAGLLPLCLIAWIAAPLARRARTSELVLVNAWLIASIAMVVMQRKYFDYHFFILIGPVAILAGQGLDLALRLTERLRARRARIAAATIVVLASLFLPARWLYLAHWLPAVHTNKTLDLLTGKLDRDSYIDRFAAADVHLGQTRRIAAFLNSRTAPQDTVLVWGFEPLINYWAKRRAPTRFEYDFPLTVEPKTRAATELRDRFRGQFFAELAASPPAYIVIIRNDKTAVEKEDSASQLLAFKRLADLLATSYTSEASVADFELYRRRP